MAGLNNLLSNSTTQATTMPAWYDTAQQNVVNQAQAAASAAPQLNQTVAQGAINTMQNPNNAFSTNTNTLTNIASGAANPWLVDASGNVKPNVNTAMGGLFQAQNQQLKQLMPNVTAAPTATGIGMGQFGSLRNQTAVNKAMGDAQAALTAQQMQAALQNQQTGVSAGAQAGNLEQQGITNAMNVGAAQQTAPFTNVSNLGKIIGGINAPATTTSQTQLAPLNQIGSLLSVLGGSSAGGVLGQLFGTAAKGTPGATGYVAPTQGILSGLSNLFSNNPAGGTAGVTQIANTATPGTEGYGWQYFSDGTSISPSGQYYQGSDLVYDPTNYSSTNTGSLIDTGGLPVDTFPSTSGTTDALGNPV